MSGETTACSIYTVANITTEGRIGGPQNRILQVAKRLKQLGRETVVIIPYLDSDKLYERLLANDIAARRLPLHRPQRRFWKMVQWVCLFIPDVFRIARQLRRDGIKLVHGNGVWQPQSVIAGKLAGCKVILHLNDALNSRFMKWLFLISRPFADAYILTGKRVQEVYLSGQDAQAKQNKPLAFIQAPVDTALFDPRTVVPEPSLNNDANDASIKIVTVANINSEKGIEYFIEMARLLTAKHQNLKFYVVGPCSDSQRKYLEELERRVAEYRLLNFSFWGPAENVAAVLKAADIFVCTSLSESGPMSVWEAMSMERPVVSTDVGDVSRYIRDDYNGFVVPIRDSAAMAEKVDLFVRDAGLRARFGKAARDTAVAELDISICAERHLLFYNEVMGCDPSGTDWTARVVEA
jgi:glycosyltransferase involved in cell wall biosynthesis